MTKSSSLSLPLANLSTALGKQGETTEPSRVKFTQQNNATTAPAALNNGAFIGKSEFQELKNLLLEKHDSQNRHFDALIRRLARRNQDQREEIPRQRTREGQPRCFTCGRTGHLAINCLECRELSPHLLPQESFPARRPNYQPHYSYNKPRDNYRNSPQQHRRDLNLAALDEHSSNEDFIAELERNTSSQVSNDSQELFHKNGKKNAERECQHHF